MIALCLILCYASYTIQNSSSTLSIVTQGDKSVIKISVITMKDSDITTVDDLSGKKIAIQNGMDQDNNEYAKEQLKKNNKKFKNMDEFLKQIWW